MIVLVNFNTNYISIKIRIHILQNQYVFWLNFDFSYNGTRYQRGISSNLNNRGIVSWQLNAHFQEMICIIKQLISDKHAWPQLCLAWRSIQHFVVNSFAISYISVLIPRNIGDRHAILVEHSTKFLSTPLVILVFIKFGLVQCLLKFFYFTVIRKNSWRLHTFNCSLKFFNLLFIRGRAKPKLHTDNISIRFIIIGLHSIF